MMLVFEVKGIVQFQIMTLVVLFFNNDVARANLFTNGTRTYTYTLFEMIV